jgi:hypothetical protein
VALLVAPATTVAEHALILLFLRLGWPALEAIHLIQEELTLRRELVAMNPVLTVIRACAFVAPESRLVFKQLTDLFHARVTSLGKMKSYYQTVSNALPLVKHRLPAHWMAFPSPEEALAPIRPTGQGPAVRPL